MRANPSAPAAVARRPPADAGRTPPAAAGRARRGLSLRARLLIAALCVALLPLVATAIGGMQLARPSLEQQGDRVLLNRARATATKIDSYLEVVRDSLVASRHQLAELAAADPQYGPDTLRAMEAVLHTDSLSRDFQITTATDFVEPAGRVVASDQTGEEGADLHASPGVRAALAQALTPTCQRDVRSCAIVGGVTFDPGAPPDLRATLAVAAPVYAPGAAVGARPIGVVRERFSIEQIASWVHDDADGQGGGGLLVERDTGLIVAQSLAPGDLTFAAIAPLSADEVRRLVADGRYAANPSVQPLPLRPIAGLQLAQLLPGAPALLSAGGFAGAGGASMRYARVALADAPDATPWVYLMARPQSAITAPADRLSWPPDPSQPSLALIALGIGLVAVALSLAVGLAVARRMVGWLSGSVEQLAATARSSQTVSDDQRQIAEEQRQRLAATRSALRDLHQVGRDLAEAIERGAGFAEEAAADHAAPAAATLAPTRPEDDRQARWARWGGTTRGLLVRQIQICEWLGREVHMTVTAARWMRERSAALLVETASLEGAAPRLPVVRAAVARPAARQPAPGAPAGPHGLNAGTFRLVLLGLLVAFGVLPSLTFAVATTTLLRQNLASQNDQATLTQARSHASALDALLGEQVQNLIALDQLYTSMTAPQSSLTPAVVDRGLAASAPDPSAALLMLASAPDGTVVAASSDRVVGSSVATLPEFQQALRFRAVVSPAYYDPATGVGSYYVADPILSADETRVVGVALGRYAMAPIRQLVAQEQSSAGGGGFALVVEAADAIVAVDSRRAGDVFEAAAPLGHAQLARVWADHRYPDGHTPPDAALAQVAAAVHAAAFPPGPAGAPPPGATGGPGASSRTFDGGDGTGGADARFWLIPLANAPWDWVEAQPLPAATAVADQLTRLDFALAVVVTALSAGLALILAQTVLAAVQRQRGRYRQLGRRLAAIARRLDDAAGRQEVALPPIEAATRALADETQEVARRLFGAALPSQVPPRAWSLPSARERRAGAPPFGLPAPRSSPRGVAPGEFVEALPTLAPAAAGWAGAGGGPPAQALRRARAVTNEWSLRQQRILADLASVLNATDELSRASAEGEREATELASVTADLLTTVQ